MRLALRRSSATIFDGGTWYLPNVKGPAGFGILLPGPHVVELEIPLGMWPQPSLRGFCKMVMLSRFVALSVSLIQKASPFQSK